MDPREMGRGKSIKLWERKRERASNEKTEEGREKKEYLGSILQDK